MEKYFVKPLLAYNKAYFVEATFRQVKNPKHENFGEWHGSTDMQYNPFFEAFSDREYFSIEEAQETLTELGFFEVKENFDSHSIADIEEIKERLSPEFYENYKAWDEYYSKGN